MTSVQSPGIDANITRVLAGLSEVAASYDVILCDVWGVIHNGVRFFPAAVDALTRFRAKGGRVVLITNAPRPNGPVQKQLDTLGVPREAYDGIVTSGDVTIAAIVDRGSQPLFHIGPPRDVALFEAVREVSGAYPPVGDLEHAAYVVATGLFGDESGVPEDCDVYFAAMRAKSMTMICANPDLVVHVGEQLRYCAGALAERYQAQGGEIVYAGKPHKPIYDASLRLAETKRAAPVDSSRVLAIGDALRTDVAGAAMQGLDVLFITAGIHRDETHRSGDGQLDPDALHVLITKAEHRPVAAMPALAW